LKKAGNCIYIKKTLHWFSNPVVVKAALKIPGIPVGSLRRPYVEISRDRLETLKSLMDELGVLLKSIKLNAPPRFQSLLHQGFKHPSEDGCFFIEIVYLWNKRNECAKKYT